MKQTRSVFFDRPVVVDGFLRPERCALLLDELEYAFWSPSTVVYREGAHRRPILSSKRTSETTGEAWFTPAIRKRLRQVGRRLEAFIPGFEERREAWQATRYGHGGKFDYHLDGGSWAADPAGDREHTVLIVLSAPRSGGSTHFLLLDLDILPVVGRLIVWSNFRRNRRPNYDSLHGSLPVRRGRKVVLVTWVRQRKHR